MKFTRTALAALALGTMLGAAKAEQSDVVATSSGGKGVFVYADYFQYIGAGAPGALVAEEQVGNYAFLHGIAGSGSLGLKSNAVPSTPKGRMGGGTAGYSMRGGNGNTYVFQLGYRRGSIDADGFALDVFNSSKVHESTFTSDYEQDTDEYRILATLIPSKFSFLSVGLEYSYGSYDGRFLGDLYTISDGSTEQKWRYGFSSKSHDVLLHVMLKTPVIEISRTKVGAFTMSPRVDFGSGYSLRSGHLNVGSGDWDKFTIPTASKLLNDDSFVLEATATMGFGYKFEGGSQIIADLGYRFKTDLDSQRYGNDQKGFYGRLGYSYLW